MHPQVTEASRGETGALKCLFIVSEPDGSPRKYSHLQTYHLLFIAVATNEPISGFGLKKGVCLDISSLKKTKHSPSTFT